jgi:hypothetical protein
MTKKIIVLLMIFVLGLALPACSGADAQTAAGDNSSEQAPGQRLEDTLAFGTLMLEGSPQAVTAEQARILLPLWKAVKSLSASDTASQEEIRALYRQIEESLTAEQVQALQAVNLSPEDLQALMTQYNIQAGAGVPAVSDDQRATRIAQRAAAGEQAGGGLPPGAGGRGGPEGGMPFEGGLPAGEMPGQANAQTTPGARPAGGFARGMNTLWLDALIQLLTERAG